MPRKAKEPVNLPVDPIDAEAALSDITGILHSRGMSSTDLAVEIGWTRKQVDEFLYSAEFPTRKQFEVVAKFLDYELELD